MPEIEPDSIYTQQKPTEFHPEFPKMEQNSIWSLNKRSK